MIVHDPRCDYTQAVPAAIGRFITSRAAHSFTTIMSNHVDPVKYCSTGFQNSWHNFHDFLWLKRTYSNTPMSGVLDSHHHFLSYSQEEIGKVSYAMHVRQQRQVYAFLCNQSGQGGIVD